MNNIFKLIKEKYYFLTDQYVTEQAILCNHLLSTFHKPTSYLEIGVDQGRTYKKINSPMKDGVDPYGTYDVTYRMTSQMFFALNKLFFHKSYDVIFIDAAHLSLIVDNEIDEAFKILKKGGYIVLHDTDPPTKEACEIDIEQTLSYLKSISYPHNASHTTSLVGKAYNGDVWKSVANIRMNRQDIRVFTVKGFCCSVLQKRKQKKILKKVHYNSLDWNYFVKNREQILNLIDFSGIDKMLKH